MRPARENNPRHGFHFRHHPWCHLPTGRLIEKAGSHRRHTGVARAAASAADRAGPVKVMRRLPADRTGAVFAVARLRATEAVMEDAVSDPGARMNKDLIERIELWIKLE